MPTEKRQMIQCGCADIQQLKIIQQRSFEIQKLIAYSHYQQCRALQLKNVFHYSLQREPSGEQSVRAQDTVCAVRPTVTRQGHRDTRSVAANEPQRRPQLNATPPLLPPSRAPLPPFQNWALSVFFNFFNNKK